MKHLALWLLAFVMAVPGIQAQSKKQLTDLLRRDLQAYRDFTMALDFDNSLQFMPPKMFDIIPKDSLKATMMEAMDNPYMKIEMTGLTFDPKYKPKLKKAGAFYWTFVPYNGSLRMILKGEPDFKKILVPVIKSQFGNENVSLQGDSIMDIRMVNKKLIAFKDPASERWAIIEDKRSEKGQEGERQKMLFGMIMPPEVLKAIDAK